MSALERRWGNSIVAMPLDELCAALRESDRLGAPLGALAPHETLEVLAMAAGLSRGVDFEIEDRAPPWIVLRDAATG